MSGELFGGAYPHKDVPANPKVKPVQTGIWYSPNIEFIAFDLAFEVENSATTGRQYADYESAIAVFTKAKLFYAEPLFVGKYEAGMAIISSIPAG